MRVTLFLLPAFLLAQTPAPKATAPATPKPAATTAPAAGTAKPAAARPAAAKTAPRPAPKPMTEDEKTIYALGLSMYRSLTQFDLSPAEMTILRQALTDAEAKKNDVIDITVYGPKIQPLATARATRLTEKEKEASAEFLRKAVVEAGAVKTDSGMVYREIRPGTGESPKATDSVKVNYRGTLIDGTEFDSSYKRNEPAQFPLNGVIPCWTEGVQRMKVGGKSLLVCPSNLAYGDQGRPSIPPGAALVFEIELLEIAPPGPAR